MILMIDNYDSFTFNVAQALRSLTDEEVVVKRNDEIDMDGVRALNPSKIVLSPGPGRPEDSGVCLEILRSNLNIPILGICLGFQAIAHVFGARIERLARPVHGKTSVIRQTAINTVFEELPSSFEVMRYHSLYAAGVKSPLVVTAVSEDGTPMAIAHESRPIYGVQFHPESYFTRYGTNILANFAALNKPEAAKSEKVNFAPFMIKLQKGFPLEGRDYEFIFSSVMSGEYDVVQLAGLLVLISERSLYPDSLAALVRSVLAYSRTYSDPDPMFDIVGTGGDALRTINISTTCAFILASLGVRVAKHGNRAVSSRSGSSDMLDNIGIKLNSDIDALRALMAKKNLAFFHAPFFHRVTAEVKEARTRLKIGTVFNILGPLLNPNLSLSNQIVGNYLEEVNPLIAETLMKLGRKHALVVHGMDGMDEITLCDETLVHEVRDGRVTSYRVSPEQFGFSRAFHADVEGGNSEENAEITKAILKGELHGAKRDIVVLNAMFGLYAADRAASPSAARPIIEDALDSGRAWEFFESYVSQD